MAVGSVKPLVVIVGPTASGKTSLAIKLAKKFDGEIICADSRSIYRGMDIGTAKPSRDDRAKVVHWGLDLVEPDQRFTVADFKDYATDRIADIRSRRKVPFLVGGTGLYIDSVIFDYQLADDKYDKNLRAKLEELDLSALMSYCNKNNIDMPSDEVNKRRIIRNIEKNGINSKRANAIIDNTIVVGIATNRNTLRTNIMFRAEQIINSGVVEESTALGDKYGWDSEAMTGIIYRLVKSYLDHDIEVEALVEKFAQVDWQLAKRQMTWFRKNPYIVWGTVKDSEHYLSDRLANK